MAEPSSGTGSGQEATGQMDAHFSFDSSSASSASEYESDESEEARLVEQETMLRVQQQARAQTQEEFGARAEDHVENQMIEKQRADAATKIQAIQRGKAARRRPPPRKPAIAMTEERAANLIKAARKDSRPRRVSLEPPSLPQAAVVIQTWIRGVLARARAFQLRLERFKMLDDPKMEGEKFATEATVFATEEPKVALKAAASMGDAVALRQQDKKELKSREKAALFMQARARGMKARREKMAAVKAARELQIKEGGGGKMRRTESQEPGAPQMSRPMSRPVPVTKVDVATKLYTALPTALPTATPASPERADVGVLTIALHEKESGSPAASPLAESPRDDDTVSPLRGHHHQPHHHHHPDRGPKSPAARLQRKSSSLALTSAESFARWGERHLVKNVAEQEAHSAVIIQAGVRGMRDRRDTKIKKDRVTSATVKIQARARGMFARRMAIEGGASAAALVSPRHHPAHERPGKEGRFNIFGDDRMVQASEEGSDEHSDESDKYSEDEEMVEHVAIPAAPVYGDVVGGEMVEEQVKLLEADWKAVPKRKKILEYACRQMAQNIVLELADAVVESQIAFDARQRAAETLKQKEANRGYRKMRDVEVRNMSTLEMLKGEQEQQWESVERRQAANVRRAVVVKGKRSAERTQQLADGATRAGLRMEEIAKKQGETAWRKEEQEAGARRVVEGRKRVKAEQQATTARFLEDKAQVRLRAEQDEVRARLVLDAQRKRQAVKAANHVKHYEEERDVIRSLANKTARRKRLHEEKDEVQFQRLQKKLHDRQEEDRRKRGAKRLEMMQVWQSALDNSSEEMGAAPGGDPNQSLRYAISTYYSAPDSSTDTKEARTMLRDKLFVNSSGKDGMSDKQVDKRLEEVFRWMDNDSTGEIELDELMGGLERLGINMKQSEVKRLLAVMDTNNDGTMTVDEFLLFGRALIEDHTDVSGTSRKHQLSKIGPKEILAHPKEELRRTLEKQKTDRDNMMREKVQGRKEASVERRRFVEEACAAYEAELQAQQAVRVESLEEMMRQRAGELHERAASKSRHWSALERDEANAHMLQRSTDRLWKERTKVATDHGERKKQEQEHLKMRFLEEQAVTASFFTQSVKKAKPDLENQMARVAGTYMGAPVSSKKDDWDALALPRVTTYKRPHTAKRTEAWSAIWLEGRAPVTVPPEVLAFRRFSSKGILEARVMSLRQFRKMAAALGIFPLSASENEVARAFYMGREKALNGSNDAPASEDSLALIAPLVVEPAGDQPPPGAASEDEEGGGYGDDSFEDAEGGEGVGGDVVAAPPGKELLAPRDVVLNEEEFRRAAKYLAEYTGRAFGALYGAVVERSLSTDLMESRGPESWELNLGIESQLSKTSKTGLRESERMRSGSLSPITQLQSLGGLHSQGGNISSFASLSLSDGRGKLRAGDGGGAHVVGGIAWEVPRSMKEMLALRRNMKVTSWTMCGAHPDEPPTPAPHARCKSAADASPDETHAGDALLSALGDSSASSAGAPQSLSLADLGAAEGGSPGALETAGAGAGDAAGVVGAMGPGKVQPRRTGKAAGGLVALGGGGAHGARKGPSKVRKSGGGPMAATHQRKAPEASGSPAVTSPAVTSPTLREPVFATALFVGDAPAAPGGDAGGGAGHAGGADAAGGLAASGGEGDAGVAGSGGGGGGGFGGPGGFKPMGRGGARPMAPSRPVMMGGGAKPSAGDAPGGGGAVDAGAGAGAVEGAGGVLEGSTVQAAEVPEASGGAVPVPVVSTKLSFKFGKK